MIEVIDEYISIINGNNIEKSNELYEDFKTISTICLPFLKEDEREDNKNKLLIILNKEKEEINNYILKNNKISYNTIQEMNLDIRKKIHPLLEEIKNEIDSRDIELEINNSINKIIEGNFEIPRNKLLEQSLNELNNVYKSIMTSLTTLSLNQQEEYKQEINNIMNTKIDYNQDIISLNRQLGKIQSRLNIIQFRIDDYIKEINSIDTSYIDLETIKKE